MLRRALHSARRAFYTAGGPWARRGVFEALGSERYSRPALHGMDAKLAALLPQHRGVFVEAGGHDGFTQSNTYYLERHRGWSGVLVEAVPSLAATARRRRPRSRVFNCALVAPDYDGQTITVHFGDLMSAVGEGREHARAGLASTLRRGYDAEVPARTLDSVLDEAGVHDIDLMVLDIEGHELDALRGLDLERHAPALLLVEMLDLPAQRPAFDELLARHFEPAGQLTAWDALYRRRR